MSADLHELARDEPEAFESVIDKAADPLKSWLEEIRDEAEGSG